MAASVYKICSCKDPLKCRHPWWFSMTRAGAPRIRASLDVVLERHISGKAEAEREASKLRLAIAEAKLTARQRERLRLPGPVVPALERLTVRQLLDAYRDRHVSLLTSQERVAYRLGVIARTELPRPDGVTLPFGEWLVTDVTADTLDRLREARSVQSMRRSGRVRHRTGGAVTANKDLRLLRGVFNWALDKGLVERSPFKRGDRTTVKLVQEQARSRRLSEGEAERLLPACGPHLRALVEAALESGCRLGEILSLQVHQVQFEPRAEIWLPAAKTKTGKARRVPMSTRLRAVIEMRLAQLREASGFEDQEPTPGTLYVFGNEIGQRLTTIKTAWRLTLQRAQIDDLHFHDLRREAGSRWMEGGVPLFTIQRWLGHANIAQTSTYLATTAQAEHDAMRRFEASRLTGADAFGDPAAQNSGETVVPSESANTATSENTVKH